MSHLFRSKRAMIGVGFLIVLACFGPKVWWNLKMGKSGGEARLGVVEANGRISTFGRGGPEIGGTWKNFGLDQTAAPTLWIVATDPSMSDTFVCFGDSANSIAPGKQGDFWVDLSTSNKVPPWPEMVMLFEARYSGDHGITQTQKWMGILEKKGSLLSSNTVVFNQITNQLQAAIYGSNFDRLLQAKAPKP